jgi:uncharacterized pyridoxal phosphate-containing UPF0001 family protein
MYYAFFFGQAIPNLHTVQTVTSSKAATALNKNLPTDRLEPLNVLLQINTSSEDAKSGLPPPPSATTTTTTTTAASHSDDDACSMEEGALAQLARHVLTTCPRLKLQGLMTIGSLAESNKTDGEENEDFERLKRTRDVLQRLLEKDEVLRGCTWGEEGKLILSMGMSSDFEAALRAGSDIVRVGTGIFGQRRKKGESEP